MLQRSWKTLTTLALLGAFAHGACAAPQMAAGALAPSASARPAHSPVPQRNADPLLLMVRDVREAGGGGGCWSHCFNSYNECVGLSEKNMCVSRMKTCMETCDRLTGLTNPIQRTQQQQR